MRRNKDKVLEQWSCIGQANFVKPTYLPQFDLSAIVRNNASLRPSRGRGGLVRPSNRPVPAPHLSSPETAESGHSTPATAVIGDCDVASNIYESESSSSGEDIFRNAIEARNSDSLEFFSLGTSSGHHSTDEFKCRNVDDVEDESETLSEYETDDESESDETDEASGSQVETNPQLNADSFPKTKKDPEVSSLRLKQISKQFLGVSQSSHSSTCEEDSASSEMEIPSFLQDVQVNPTYCSSFVLKNMPYTADEKELKFFIDGFGACHRCDLTKDPAGGLQAVVVMKPGVDASWIVESLHGMSTNNFGDKNSNQTVVCQKLT